MSGPSDYEFFRRDGHPILEAAAGYARWAPAYDEMLTEVTDGAIYDAFAVNLPPGARVLDLACGTGRSLAMLRARTATGPAVGVDLSPEMLARAEAKGIYAELHRADLTAAADRLASAAFDLVLCGLACCHLPELDPFYALAARALASGGACWMIDLHPHMFYLGKGTNVPLPGGKVNIRNYIHPVSEHLACARAHGLQLQDMAETEVPEAWDRVHPVYGGLVGHPLGLGLRFLAREDRASS